MRRDPDWVDEDKIDGLAIPRRSSKPIALGLIGAGCPTTFQFEVTRSFLRVVRTIRHVAFSGALPFGMMFLPKLQTYRPALRLSWIPTEAEVETLFRPPGVEIEDPRSVEDAVFTLLSESILICLFEGGCLHGRALQRLRKFTRRIGGVGLVAFSGYSEAL